jgi:hypothetical protein
VDPDLGRCAEPGSAMTPQAAPMAPPSNENDTSAQARSLEGAFTGFSSSTLKADSPAKPCNFAKRPPTCYWAARGPRA